MSDEYQMDYSPGEVRASCSICGMSYRFPSELVRGIDKLFRCTATCVEEPPMARDRKIASYRNRKQLPPPRIGLPRPPFDPDAP